MDSPEHSVLLTLLTGDNESALADKLGLLIGASDDFSLAHGPGRGGPWFDIIYRGVAMRLSVTPVPDLTIAKQIFCNLDPQTLGAGVGIALGDHVAGGERVPVIIQTLLGAARQLGTGLNAVAILWRPADILSGFAYFDEAVAAFLDGGAFPVLAMVNFKADEDGTIKSTGLAALSGQELLIDGHTMDQSELMRRVVRVVHDIAVNGPFREATELSGIELGEVIAIELLEPGILKMNACLAPVQ